MKIALEKERISRGWTRKYVAKQVGLTSDAICLIETGRRKPSYKVLVKLEDLFQLGHRELFRIADEDSPVK